MQPGATVRPSRKASLPAAPAGWFPVDYAITADGHLARICATVDVDQRRRDHLARFARGEHSDAMIVPPVTQARVDLFNGENISEGPPFELESAFPKFDRCADGSWIVADSRCPVGELNARVIRADGTVTRRICLGDGILSLQGDQLGCIWVGYFDEGIFGNGSWGAPGRPIPIGAPGINRFDEFGHVLPTYRMADLPGPVIDDCYAMNVTPDGIWLCPYSDFPILRIGYDGTSRLWQNKTIRGASAIAVDGDNVVLVGGYQEHKDRGALLRLSEDRAELSGEFRFDADGSDFDSLRLLTARNDMIHFVTNDDWYRIEVAEIAAMVL